jgi:hypothetical protein
MYIIMSYLHSEMQHVTENYVKQLERRLDYVKEMEQRMNGVFLPKYGTDEYEQPPNIYTVPQEIKGGNEVPYLPFAVKIGPLTR